MLMPCAISQKMILGFLLLLRWGCGMYVYDILLLRERVPFTLSFSFFLSLCFLLYCNLGLLFQHEIVPSELVERIASLKYDFNSVFLEKYFFLCVS